MWIWTPDGFLSIVAHREDSKRFLVRARRRQHLEAWFPDHEIIELQDADYRYRANIFRGEVIAAVKRAVEAITYDNFKNTLHDPLDHAAAMSVWLATLRMQPSSKGDDRFELSLDPSNWHCRDLEDPGDFAEPEDFEPWPPELPLTDPT